jgi:thiol-disulfide isomerase/thioredoxin
VWDARNLLSGIAVLGTHIRAAHYLPDELLKVHGEDVRCTVLHYGTEDSTARRVNDSTGDTVLWVDPTSLTVLKVETRVHSRIQYGMHPTPFGRIVDSTTTTIYNVVELGYEPKPDTFTFSPPADSREVAMLPTPYPEDTAANATKGPTPAEQLAIAHIGKQLPAIILHDTNGNDVPLAKFTGHPVLIDLWATWCGPCVNELPSLNHIRKSTAGSDLQMIAIDEDTQPGVAADLLKRRGYDWQDFHFNRTVTAGLPSTGIPLIVLADATGRIVYYHTGANDTSGLAQAIAKLGKEYRSVKTD